MNVIPDPQHASKAVDSSDGAFMYSFLSAAHALEERLEGALAGVGLSLAKHGVLSHLVEAGKPLTLGELATCLCCVRSNMTQLVDRLEADGLVRRVDDPTDRRMVRAALTSVGEERQAAGARQVDKVEAEFVASLAAAERAALERALGALQ